MHKYRMMAIAQSILIFLLASLCEIGGGYLVWQCLRQGKPWWYGLIGALLLALYGMVATWQQSSFGRVYIAYGGIFIILSLVWAWKFDGFRPDRYDVIGLIIILIGVCFIFYTPRVGQ